MDDVLSCPCPAISLGETLAGLSSIWGYGGEDEEGMNSLVSLRRYLAVSKNFVVGIVPENLAHWRIQPQYFSKESVEIGHLFYFIDFDWPSRARMFHYLLVKSSLSVLLLCENH